MTSIAVIGVTIFILFVISSQWLLIYHPLNFYGNIWGQSYIIIYHLISLLLLRCYWLSIINKPGSPDANWLPDGKTQQDLNILVEQFKDKSKILGNSSGNGFGNFGGKGKSTTVLVDDDLSTVTVINSKNNSNNKKARFCSQCCVFKPPRTHHCKQCKTCVLKHDHHCPWIDNCTGFRNQKFFYQFLFYVVILCSITILTLTISGFYILNVNLDPIIDESNIKQRNQRNQERIIGEEESDEIQFLIHSSLITILYVFNFSGVTPVLLGVSGLFFYQTEFLLGNYTPVERHERKKESKTAKKNGMKYSWKYDHGWKQNFKQVMGDSIIQWFLPIGIPKTDGTYWKENEQYIQQQRILNSNSISNNNTFNNNNINNNEHMDKQPLLNGANHNYDNDDEIELNDYINKSSTSSNINQPHHTQEKTRFGLVENV